MKQVSLMVNRGTTARERDRKFALLILFMASVIWLTQPSAHSAFNLGQEIFQPQPDAKPKCESLGFVVYEKWQKPTGLFPFYEDCKLGYIDNKGRTVISPQFDRAGYFYEGLAVVANKINGDLKYGYINQTGRFVITLEFDSAGNFSDGFAAIRFGGKSGYIDRTGQVVISPQFAEATPFYRGLARVRIFTNEGTFRGRWGVINKKGEFVVPPKYDHIQHFTEPAIFAGIITNEKWRWRLISWTGKTIIEPETERIENLRKGIDPIKFKGKPKITDNVRTIWGSEEYTRSIIDFSKGLIPVSINEQLGYLNLQGELVISPRSLSAQAFSEGPVPILVGRKYGYIDKTGKMVTSLRFDKAIPFSEGLARVRIDMKYGFIDKKGVLKITPQFSSVTHFRGGVALAWADGYQGYIDKKGKFLRRWPYSPKVLPSDNQKVYPLDYRPRTQKKN
ncbi:MAG TPA: WG repeat-containing protein [Pyrinomonadaceae bacterium]